MHCTIKEAIMTKLITVLLISIWPISGIACFLFEYRAWHELHGIEFIVAMSMGLIFSASAGPLMWWPILAGVP